jgi:hypothetical protein
MDGIREGAAMQPPGLRRRDPPIGEAIEAMTAPSLSGAADSDRG